MTNAMPLKRPVSRSLLKLHACYAFCVATWQKVQCAMLRSVGVSLSLRILTQICVSKQALVGMAADAYAMRVGRPAGSKCFATSSSVTS